MQVFEESIVIDIRKKTNLSVPKATNERGLDSIGTLPSLLKSLNKSVSNNPIQ
jgi:hypothetical protein